MIVSVTLAEGFLADWAALLRRLAREWPYMAAELTRAAEALDAARLKLRDSQPD